MKINLNADHQTYSWVYPESTQFVRDGRAKKQWSEKKNSNIFLWFTQTATNNKCWMLNEWIRSVSQSIYYARLFQKIRTNWIKIALIFLLPFSFHWFTFFPLLLSFSFHFTKEMIYNRLKSIYDYFMLLLFATKRFVWYSPNKILHFHPITFVKLALLLRHTQLLYAYQIMIYFNVKRFLRIS